MDKETDLETEAIEFASALSTENLRRQLALELGVRDTLDDQALIGGAYNNYYSMRDDCTIRVLVFIQELVKRHRL